MIRNDLIGKLIEFKKLNYFLSNKNYSLNEAATQLCVVLHKMKEMYAMWCPLFIITSVDPCAAYYLKENVTSIFKYEITLNFRFKN